jgi:hypothetical protein
MGGYSRLEHIKMIQAIIGRLAQNSFLLKGWSVTLNTGLLAASLTDKGVFSALAIFPAVAFWGLDGYYLMEERLFREFHEAVSQGRHAETSGYSMEGDVRRLTGWGRARRWLQACLAPVVVGLHGVVLVVILMVLAVTSR